MLVGTKLPIRMDKWLWAVRVYRTRSLATDACKAGHVKVDGSAVKPSRAVALGDIVTATVGRITRKLKVVSPIERRVGAKLLDQYIEDLTPPKEFEKSRLLDLPPLYRYSKGKGRPTKRDRREIDRLESSNRNSIDDVFSSGIE